MSESSCAQTLRQTLSAEMRAQPGLLFFHHMSGAEKTAAGASLQREHGSERVRGFPSPLALMNAALGAALAGQPVVLEVQGAAALTQGLPALLHAAKHASGAGARRVPMLLWANQPAGLESILAPCAGLSVVWPAAPHDAVGLLRGAVRRLESPVVFLSEPHLLESAAELPEDDFTIPLGSAAVRRHGKNATIVAYGGLLAEALAACEAAAGDGLEAELIDLRCLRPLDLNTVTESLKKTGRILLCSPAPKTGNLMCELAMLINETAFDELDAPIRRLCAPDSPLGDCVCELKRTQILEALRDLASC